MEVTIKQTCRILADLLSLYGVRDIVVAPGSRNAPLILAFARSNHGFRLREVIDERSAAFVALGMALQSGRPVAVACTSGTALLNFAPAVAEAFYRRVPLIAISADRPACWIDQDDSQTIRQPGALATITRAGIDIPVEDGSEQQLWFVNRKINDALSAATGEVCGPVHINIQLDEPLTGAFEVPSLASGHKINTLRPVWSGIAPGGFEDLFKEILSCRRVMIVAGFHSPSARLNRALTQLSRLPGFAVLAEAQSNLRASDGSNIIFNIDSTLRCLRETGSPEEFRPHVVLTCGGALLSRHIKAYLRGIPGLRHVSVGHSDCAIDCFKALETRVECDAEVFFEALAAHVSDAVGSDYAERWQRLDAEGRHAAQVFERDCPWSDFKAMSALTRMLASGPGKSWNLHFSNGTAIRYAQLFDYSHLGRIECNRGVSGIDGSTSTAAGAYFASSDDEITMLVTGDMSAQYDMGALALGGLDGRFKIAVLNNGGGGIFRFISSTSSLPELEKYFVGDVRLPLRELAAGYGFRYFEAHSEEELMLLWPEFSAIGPAPAILNILTPGDTSSTILKKYFQ